MTRIKPYRFKTLRSRLTVLLVSPVVLILLAAGIWGFIYARNAMLQQWTEHVMLQLEQAAGEIEMGLSWPVELMKLFAQSGADGTSTNLLAALEQKMNTLPGVVGVHANWHGPPGDRQPDFTSKGLAAKRFRRFHRGAFTRISPPAIDEDTGKRSVSINMMLMDASDTPVGNLEIVMLFEALVADITSDPWWQSATACIADRATGNIVLASGLMQGRRQLGETGDGLEHAVKDAMGQKSAGILPGKGKPPERIAGFHSLDTFPWALVAFAEGQTILAPIIHFRNGFIIGAGILVLIIFIIIRFNVDRISAAVRKLSDRAGTIAAGEYEEKIGVGGRDEISQLADSFNTMIDGLKERDAIRNTFGLYVNPDFARALLKRPDAGRLGGRRREVAILMADIRGFTPMTEKMPPEETIDVLNRYFSAIIPLIKNHQGIIVDFVGDGILVFFEPIAESLATTTQRCVRCAFAMQRAMVLLNQKLDQRSLPEITMGIGINSGPVVVGNIGSETRKKYGIVGSSVNITQRIQGQSHSGEVVLPRDVYRLVQSDVVVQRSFSASLKGVASEVQLVAIASIEASTHESKRT